MHSQKTGHMAVSPGHPAVGFTLVELMATMSIGMLLLISGIPAMHELIQRNLHSSHINTFVSSLHYSRSEAVKRGGNVVMCRGHESGCARTAGWHKGWLIFADQNQNREYDTGDQLLRFEQGWDDGIKVTSGRRRRIVYQPTGYSPGTNGTYVFCNPSYPDMVSAVILSNTGRPRLSKKRPGGKPLRCI